VTEVSELESLFGATPANAPDRAPIARRLAEDYVELSHAARADVAARASERAIHYYGVIRTDYPGYAQGDEVAYFLGYEYERAGDVAQARRAYFDVVAKYPNSRFVPYAYFAFGELFLREADADPSKFDLALQAFRKVVTYARSDLAPEAMLRVGTIHARRGEKAEAAGAFQRLRRDYPTSPAADGAPRL
jgi:TolA-binding protein